MDVSEDEIEFLEFAEIQFIISWNILEEKSDYRELLNKYLDLCKKVYKMECIDKNRSWRDWYNEK